MVNLSLFYLSDSVGFVSIVHNIKNKVLEERIGKVSSIAKRITGGVS